MNQEDPAIQIHNLILKKDSITTSTDKIQEEVPKIMKTKEKINMAILVKEMIDLKDQITISILKMVYLMKSGYFICATFLYL